MTAAGVNAKGPSVYTGHENITVALDRYGHLMPGSDHEAVGLLDVYLALSDERARTAGRHRIGALARAPLPAVPAARLYP